MKLPRCPYCGLITELTRDDSPPEVGQFAVCAGCAGAARFVSDCRRLERFDLEVLSDRLRNAIMDVQRTVRDRLAADGVPPGHSFRNATLCERCSEEFDPGVVPVFIEPAPWENCAFCEKLTRSGIVRRLLLPHRVIRTPQGMLS